MQDGSSNAFPSTIGVDIESFNIATYDDTTTQTFNGSIDDVKIYNRVLSQGEIQKRYKKDSLVGYWKFDDVGTSVTADSSGNGNDGTLTNMDGASDYIDGQVGKALEFDGRDDYVDLGMTTALDLEDNITFSAWFNKKTTDNGKIIELRRVTTASNTYGYGVSVSTNVKFIVGFGDSNIYELSSQSINLNEWYHVIGIRNGTQILLYLNGELVDSMTVPNNQIAYSSYDERVIGIHRDKLSNPFNGSIDEVAIYSRSLSDLEIRQAYESTRPRFEVQQKESTETEYDIPEKIEQDLLLETINDVFIYDTKKDSIDDTWRSNSSKSWHTEASSETRCPNGYQESGAEKCTRDFPEVALIVATNDNLYIYDAESQERWMRFDSNEDVSSSSTVYYTNEGAYANSLFALNSQIYVAETPGSSLLRIAYKEDTPYWHGTSGLRLFNGNITQRNS